MKKIVVIPARLGSSRLPEKVILDLAGKPVVQWVYERALSANYIDEVYIATDSERVKEICLEFTENVIMTSEAHQSGTDRIAEAVQSIEADVIINVQGDEPLISPEVIDQLAGQFDENPDLQMGSVKTPISKVHDALDPNVVKVVTNAEGYAIYFSRSPIPYPRDLFDSLQGVELLPEDLKYFKHLGIYGYTKDFIQKYSQLTPTYLETTEKLEQLRVLENGYAIKMVETDYSPVGIDTAEDLEKARKIMETLEV
ncbi:3-deoxy-manno-octulosonate cytidylyltransferase [Aureibacter tunicatorum]|uniref:3-deoxy-manno-octulosonate cytidylyltransferase n=1 Tax=Aureibacter tunicatorum TaxID=866807 RepID=A0AAE3XR63_9BACT|nr:3-deoxy-manno-octulosonate cytidylyltransferase [Aureibacter tunicatorum]MDR6240420.1 3-deoxy-manno-octulosonate cytidylyltransferase (CMP-KDO synthetase) [Aureibacter tunicatorum]BDD05701.1 3-deoxy-manno-octulosonate cytidylyltransferase [Aureibacter tunicatorum]